MVVAASLWSPARDSSDPTAPGCAAPWLEWWHRAGAAPRRGAEGKLLLRGSCMVVDETQPGDSAALTSWASSPAVAVPAWGQLSNAEIHP